MEMKQNQTLFHGTYLILMSFLFYQKILKYFLSFMTKVKPNNKNETKGNIFSWEIFTFDIIFHYPQNTKLFQ